MKLAEAPRLPKLPFILGDIALLLLAAGIAVRHPTPWAPLPLLVITGCVIAGAIASFIPYLLNYARDQEVAAASLRHELGEQFKRLMVASEHFQHATVQLKAIEDAATKSLEAARDLPRQIGEQLDEFHRQLDQGGRAAGQTPDQEMGAQWPAELERLSALTEKLAALSSEWSDREADARGKFADAARLEEQLAGLLASAQTRLNQPVSAEVAPPASVSETPPTSVASPADPVAPTESTDAAPPEPKPPRKRHAPRNPTTEAPAAEVPAPELSQTEPPPELVVEPVTDEAPAPDDFSQVPPGEGAPVHSDDGSTRLTVTAYVGIGNKLYLRGDGPGLRWDKGVPLQFVSIGRWRWETQEATESFTCQLYKNDKIQSPLGLLTLTPGIELEVTATF